jgi:hypothetical protein
MHAGRSGWEEWQCLACCKLGSHARAWPRLPPFAYGWQCCLPAAFGCEPARLMQCAMLLRNDTKLLCLPHHLSCSRWLRYRSFPSSSYCLSGCSSPSPSACLAPWWGATGLAHQTTLAGTLPPHCTSLPRCSTLAQPAPAALYLASPHLQATLFSHACTSHPALPLFEPCLPACLPGSGLPAC